MAPTQTAAQPASIPDTPTRRRERSAPFSSGRSDMWYDNDSSSGEDKEEEDGDTDSLTSAESNDSIVTPESSPPQNRHAVLPPEDDGCTPAIGAFDANGTWVWSNRSSEELKKDPCLSTKAQGIYAAVGTKPVLNRHDRAHIVMAGNVNQLAGQRRASDVLWSETGSLTHDILPEDDDDSYDVVGFTSYRSGAGTAPTGRGEGHRFVVPLRIRLEDDSSSDESETSIVTNSSSGSDSEARRRASINMLQRIGKTVTIPQRRASALRIGQGAPRRPPSLDEISNRVVAGGGGNSYGRGTPLGSAVPHQRAVSCPSPLPLQRERFGEVEVMVTPATPKMSAEKIPGVVLKSPHMPSSASFSTDALGHLLAPAFDVAPGRQLILEERERQAKRWLENFKSQQQQQERQGLNLKLGAGPVAPPMAHGAQAAAIITPSSPTRNTAGSHGPHDDAPTALRQSPGGPPIPPRRRSFGRRIPMQPTSNEPVPPPAVPSPSPTGSAGGHPEVPERIRSPINIPTVRAEGSTASTMRRSLVARLSLRRSSKELRDEGIPAQISRKPVPVA